MSETVRVFYHDASDAVSISAVGAGGGMIAKVDYEELLTALEAVPRFKFDAYTRYLRAQNDKYAALAHEMNQGRLDANKREATLREGIYLALDALNLNDPEPLKARRRLHKALDMLEYEEAVD